MLVVVFVVVCLNIHTSIGTYSFMHVIYAIHFPFSARSLTQSLLSLPLNLFSIQFLLLLLLRSVEVGGSRVGLNSFWERINQGIGE